jgi:hypothetical protein
MKYALPYPRFPHLLKYHDRFTSKIHKTQHPFTISKGRVMVCIDAGEWVEYEAPYTGITQAGTRRVLYVVEDCVWTTYHLNPSNTEDLQEIEDRIIEKHENPFINNIKNIGQ